MDLSELQLDALKEIFNIGISQAAKQLSILLADNIVIDVQDILFIDRKEVKKKIKHQERESFLCVKQPFSGDLGGNLSLFFSNNESRLFIASLTGEDGEEEGEITDLEGAAVLEISNIITSRIISTLTSFFGFDFEVASLNFVNSCEADKLSDSSEKIFLMKVILHATTRNVVGSIFLLLDTPSIEKLQHCIDEKFLNSLGGV